MTSILPVAFTACWITHAVPLPSRSACETLRPQLLAVLAALEPLFLFTAECLPAGTDVGAVERDERGDEIDGRQL